MFFFQHEQQDRYKTMTYLYPLAGNKKEVGQLILQWQGSRIVDVTDTRVSCTPGIREYLGKQLRTDNCAQRMPTRVALELLCREHDTWRLSGECKDALWYIERPSAELARAIWWIFTISSPLHIEVSNLLSSSLWHHRRTRMQGVLDKTAVLALPLVGIQWWYREFVQVRFWVLKHYQKDPLARALLHRHHLQGFLRSDTTMPEGADQLNLVLDNLDRLRALFPLPDEGEAQAIEPIPPPWEESAFFRW